MRHGMSQRCIRPIDALLQDFDLIGEPLKVSFESCLTYVQPLPYPEYLTQ